MRKVIDNWINRYFADEEAVSISLIMVAGLAVIVLFGGLLAPFLAALVFAFLLQGIVNQLTRWHVPYLLAVILVFTGFMGLFFASVVFLFPIVIEQFSNLAQELPRMILRLRDIILSLPANYPNLVSEERLAELISYIQQESTKFAEAALSFSVSQFPNLIVVMVYLILVPLLIFFMLKDRDYLVAAFAEILPKRRHMMVKVWQEMNIQIANYIQGKAAEVLVVGYATYICFKVLDLNYAALLALLVGISVVIPYIGAVLVTIPVMLVGLLQWGWGGDFFWLFFIYLGIQFVDGNILVPLLFSEAVNLHPIAIILAVLIFGGIWGFWGVFFAIPLATLIKAIYNAWPRNIQPESNLAEEVLSD